MKINVPYLTIVLIAMLLMVKPVGASEELPETNPKYVTVNAYWLKYKKRVYFITTDTEIPKLNSKQNIKKYLSVNRLEDISKQSVRERISNGFIFTNKNTEKVKKAFGYGKVKVRISNVNNALGLVTTNANLRNPMYQSLEVTKVKVRKLKLKATKLKGVSLVAFGTHIELLNFTDHSYKVPENIAVFQQNSPNKWNNIDNWTSNQTMFIESKSANLVSYPGKIEKSTVKYQMEFNGTTLTSNFTTFD